MLSSKNLLTLYLNRTSICENCTIQILNDTSFKKFAPVQRTNEHLGTRFAPDQDPVAPISIPVTPISDEISHIPIYSHLSSVRLHISSAGLHHFSRNLNISLKQCHINKIQFHITIRNLHQSAEKSRPKQQPRPSASSNTDVQAQPLFIKIERNDLTMENIRKQAEQAAIHIEKYVTNEDTYMILPIRAVEYYSIVREKDAIYYVKQTPFEIIKHTCWELDWTTYEARSKAIAEKLYFPHKTPIMLSKEKKIIAFPTMAPAHVECSWFFLHPDVNTGRILNQATLFINWEQKIALDIPYHTLQVQYEKALQLKNAMLANHNQKNNM